MTFAQVVNNFISFINNSLIPLLFALAFLFFLVGLVRFFFSDGDENRQKGRQFALWGMIGLIVLFSIWGIVNLLLATFS
ncbi:MAG TPA: hypothetical protein VHC20_04975 [Candidatus Paceibacterota bacterium]|nr:hypothetical protein [Candidatus Paceibacterota bacterium]